MPDGFGHPRSQHARRGTKESTDTIAARMVCHEADDLAPHVPQHPHGCDGIGAKPAVQVCHQHDRLEPVREQCGLTC